MENYFVTFMIKGSLMYYPRSANYESKVKISNIEEVEKLARVIEKADGLEKNTVVIMGFQKYDKG